MEYAQAAIILVMKLLLAYRRQYIQLCLGRQKATVPHRVCIHAALGVEGFGQVTPGRLSLMASQVSDAFNTKSRVNADAVWTGSFLPSKAELNVLPAVSKK